MESSKKVTEEEKVAAAGSLNESFLSYTRTQEDFRLKIQTGVAYLIKTYRFLKWMIFLLLLIVCGQYYLIRKLTNQNAVERADIAVARKDVEHIQKNAIRRDSLFNQKKPMNVKTVNAAKVDVVNANSVNIKKK